jgi:hypothetical protein
MINKIRLVGIAILAFFIFSTAKAQTVTIVQPNGGEILYACQQYLVTWTQTGSPSNYWNIDYSLDGGTIWTSVTSNYLSTNGQFLWTVPNVQSTTVLMRVRDALNSSTTDQSNAFFTINIPVLLTSPNGGEVWQGNTVQNITWNAIGTSNTYNIAYSTNGGTSWINIVTNYFTAGGTYAWTVPAIAGSTNCLVRVMDYVTNCMQDVSNLPFTITPPQPILLTPNGGGSLSAQCPYNITWNAASMYTSVVLEYSTNNGSTWNMIVNGASNTGTYNWTVPNLSSTQCLIRISNYLYPALTDVSNATFTINNPLTVTAANGAETWYGCNTYNITWNASSCIQYFNIQYSTNNGTSWNTIASGVSNTAIYNSGNTNQTYSWLVPNGITSNQALIRIQDYYNTSTVFDVSNAVFNINPNVDITITSPNGGEVWQGLSNQTITWTNLPAASGLYNLQYSTNGGSTWINITTNFSGNSYNWTVPNINNTTCRIRVLDAVNTCKLDISDANFTIAPAQPILLTPNGGESLSAQCPYNITWNAASMYTSVVLEYSTNNGSTWNMIVNGASNTGTYNWTVPNLSSTQCLIRISNYLYPALTDVSNATFTINNPLTVTAANGAETWYGCNTYNITWNASSCIQYFNIQYSTNNGTSWNTIASGVSNTAIYNSGNTNQTYSWLVPNGITSNQALIRIQDYYNTSTVFDVSNAVFNINPNVDITITSPNGGEVWQGLSNQTITWTNLPAASGLYNLQYSTNGGSTWINITTNFSGNSYNWTVPNINNTTCRIRVLDAVNTCKLDISDANFTIAPAQPILLTPNGGESLYAGTNYNITWNTASMYTSVVLEYSTNNGSTWNMIVNGASNTGTYNWNVPNANSTQCLVRISNYLYPAITDVSNAVFTIKPAVTILTPNGDNGVTIWGGCTVTSITFDRSPAWSSYNISYSFNNGASWNTIVTNWNTSSNPATYNWNIPNVSTNQALVRVTPVSTSYSDQSDAVFTITKPVTIIQPNFGGIMSVGSAYNIQWQSDGISNIYDIFYSTNSGGSWTNIVMGFNTSLNTYPWTVPNTPSTNCLIVVRDNINHCKSDTSNIPFTISTTPAAITLTSPNGIADTLTGCSTKLITWTDSPTIGTYDLHYSLNGGSTWTPIVTGYVTATHNYSWIVPNTINSNTVLLRVRSTASPTTVFDLSNAYFTILNGQLVAIPDDTTVCTGVPVQLNTTGGVNYNWSPAAGLSATNIANPIATPSISTTYLVQSINGSCILTDTVHVNVTAGAAIAGVSVNASPTTTICSGTSVTFTATPTNGGATPNYQWTVNGINAGTNSPIYVTSTLNNGDIVNCIMTSNLTCVSGSPATSSNIVMVVNTIPSVPGTISGLATICSGSSNTYSITAVPGATSYTWTLPGGWSGTSTTNSINTSAGATGGNITVMANNTCGSSSPQTLAVVVNSIPATPGTISGAGSICAGSAHTYSITAIPGATSYTWTLPGGWSGTSTTNSINTTASTTGGNITVTANNACGSSSLQTLAVIVNTSPSTPGSISGSSTICSGSLHTYSITTVPGATSYTWTLPSGWSGTSTTNSINATASATSGNITVTANNTCGNSSPQTLAITVNTIPATPGTISGATSICAGSVNTYSVTSVPGATSYTWTLPGGWSGTSTTNSINATASATSGNITVTADNACGFSSVQTLAIIVNTIPATPGTISGAANICAGSSNTYSVPAVPGATSYTWTLPGGWFGTSTTNSINTTAGATGGNITVTANNACGISAVQTLAIGIITAPTAPGIISGSANICAGSSNTYSITVVPDATSYTWTLPGGWSGSSITNFINTTASSTSGNITVTADNACGSSTPQTLAIIVNPAPATPGTISGVTSVCNGSSNTYSITSVPGATSYTWTLPGGWSGSSITNSINTTASATSGNVTVTANNACGSSSAQTLAVTINTIPSTPGSISGSTTICSGSSNTYSVTNDPSATSYTWTLPGGWSGTSTTNSINTTANAVGGNITVTANNACGNSTPQTLVIVVNTVPSAPGTISGLTTICDGSSNTYSITAVPGATSYTWTLPGGWSGTSTTNSINTTASATSGNITVTADNTCGSSAPQTLAITVNTAPPTPGTISGSTSICDGSSNTYSITAVPGATSYTWTLPGGWSGTSTTNSINTTANTTSGNITVAANNSCGNSSPQTLVITVNTTPTTPTTISGLTTICDGTSNTYSITAVPGATSYTWTLPGGWSGTSTTNSINTTASATSGNITVTADNTCGSSSPQTLAITVNTAPATPGTISGSASICDGSSNTYSITAVPGATSYIWTLPGGWSGTSTTNSINTTASGTSGNITVAADNTCGTSSSQTLVVTVNPLPTVNFNYSGQDTVCINHSLQILNGGTPVGGTYSGTGVTGTNFDPNAAGLGTHNITYSYTDANLCSNTDIITITVIGCTGIDPSGANEIVVYPNPFTNSISLSGIEGITEVKLYNALGEILSNWIITEGNNIINTENLRSGIYFLTIGTTTKKIIKH